MSFVQDEPIRCLKEVETYMQFQNHSAIAIKAIR